MDGIFKLLHEVVVTEEEVRSPRPLVCKLVELVRNHHLKLQLVPFFYKKSNAEQAHVEDASEVSY